MPKRPTENKKILRRAIKKVASETNNPEDRLELFFYTEKNKVDIDKVLRTNFSNLSKKNAAMLRKINHAISDELDLSIIQWVIDNGIKPKLSVGMLLEEGIIIAINTEKAKYSVKEHGVNILKKYEKIMVNFEDAEPCEEHESKQKSKCYSCNNLAISPAI